jgi:hypothetical protein
MTTSSEATRVVAYQVPTPGMVWVEEERNVTSLVSEHDGQQVPRRREKVVRKRVEVLGATPQIVTRARVTYLEHTVRESQAGTDRHRRSPIVGKRYLLDATGGTIVVTGDGAVSAEEEAAVRAEEKKFGRPETIGMVIAGLRYRPGEPVVVPPAVASRLFGGELAVTALELTFGQRSGDDAEFAMRLRLEGSPGGNDTVADFAGTLRVDASNGLPREMRLDGPVRVGGKMVAEGTGELVATRTPEPRSP